MNALMNDVPVYLHAHGKIEKQGYLHRSLIFAGDAVAIVCRMPFINGRLAASKEMGASLSA